MKKSSMELISDILKYYRVGAGVKVDLKSRNPGHAIISRPKKKDENALINGFHEKLSRLQGLLYAESKHKVLIVLQGMDTSGKDGTIRHVFKGVNPQGVRVGIFKVPTQDELDHDYLWRVHQKTPKNGEIVIFNRSHYEDVVIARVHNLVPGAIWSRRFAQINDFERMLSEEGAVLIKFFLHIDKDEQKKRLEERLQDSSKNWKFSKSDIEERKFWPKYMKAYEDAISSTSTPWAPWHIIPSNKKWYRNLVISQIIIRTLEQLDMKYPKANKEIKDIIVV